MKIYADQVTFTKSKYLINLKIKLLNINILSDEIQAITTQVHYPPTR